MPTADCANPMNAESPDNHPAAKSSAREFFLILVCAAGLSVAFVQWMKSSIPAERGGLEIGKPAPPIKASMWVNGPAPKPEDLKGNVYVVIAWATWCLPCYEEAPHLVDVYEKYHPKGVQFYGLAGQQETLRPEIENWLADANITWPNGFGIEAVNTLLALKVELIPAMWVIGKDGSVLWNASKMADEPLGDAIERALRQ